MSKKEQPPRLCPFKIIAELGCDDKIDKAITNQRFAPCDEERCMAYYKVGTREMCRRLEAGK